jgi:hypothetical protein
MQALSTATSLDWGGWFRGLIGAFVSGGAGAIGGATGATMLDPKVFNLNDGLGITLKLMGVAFLISGIVSLAKYLQTAPVPNAPKP